MDEGVHRKEKEAQMSLSREVDRKTDHSQIITYMFFGLHPLFQLRGAGYACLQLHSEALGALRARRQAWS